MLTTLSGSGQGYNSDEPSFLLVLPPLFIVPPQHRWDRSGGIGGEGGAMRDPRVSYVEEALTVEGQRHLTTVGNDSY